MSTQPFDPARYKAGQRREWDAAASGLKYWWQVAEPALQPVSERMMELADIQPGQRVLDVATGIGEPAVTAARRVGPSGHVIATDLSPQMLALGRERVAELGLPLSISGKWMPRRWNCRDRASTSFSAGLA